MKKRWYDYLWIVSPIYLGLGFFNILFAWLGLIFFVTPLLIAIFGGSKGYCNRYCDRGQFLRLLGGKLRLSRNKPIPKWMGSNAFRYGFLIFFFIMFFQMLWTTYLVGPVQDLRQFVKLFWTFKVPWQWAYHGGAAPWVAQFAFGFYSVMLTSTLLGMIVMVLYKPRAWCVFCPMGTMTQLICRLKAGKPPVQEENVPVRCEDDCETCGDRKKREALQRMKALTLQDSVVERFKTAGEVYISNPIARLCEIDPATEAEQAIVKAFETAHDALVYHMIRNETELGVIYSILYVSSAEEDWPKARNGLEGGLGDVRYTRAYCYYAGYVLDNTEPLGDGSGEFTSIGVLPLLGGVIRIE